MRARSIAAAAIILVAAALFPAEQALAAGSNICASTCTRNEVGPFMYGISQACGNEGTCSLSDIQVVFNNVANFVLEIVGALVFLMYVIGGFYFLLSGMPGMEKYREKGKTALKTSTIGLVIVFGSYAFMQTLFGVLQGSDLGSGTEYVLCGPGTINSGEACALNSLCTDEGLCQSDCERGNNPTKTVTGGKTTLTWQQCFDPTIDTTLYGITPGSSTENDCPGPATQRCYQFTYTSQ